MVAGAAWSVPAIVLATTTPAFAGSGTLRVGVSSAGNTIPATGATAVKATVTDQNGVAQTGKTVTFQVPTGATASPASAVTDSNGFASTTVNLGSPWAKPGSTATVVALCESTSATGVLTVLGSNLLQAPSSSKTFAQTELVFPSAVVQAVAVGFYGPTTYVVLENGSIWCRGANESGQLGDGTTSRGRTDWAPIPNLTDVVQVAAMGSSAFALRSDGTVWAWGDNAGGSLGDGTTTSTSTPIQIAVGGRAVQLTTGNAAAYVVLDDGTVAAWGANGYGELGDETTTNRSRPGKVLAIAAGSSQPLSGVASVAAGWSYALARLSDGTVASWGYNAYGQLGLGTTGDVHRPTLIPGMHSIAAVSANAFDGYALSTSGALVAWGNNQNGSVGDGTTTNRLSPVAVSGLSSDVSQVIGSGYEGAYRLTAQVVLADGSVRTWGMNNMGQLGDGSTTTRLAPITPTLPAGCPGIATLGQSKTVRNLLISKTA